MANDKSIEMLRDGQPYGVSNKSNLKDWADYAKGNSYHCEKAQLKANLGTEGASADYAAHDVKDWEQPQRKSEGRGWTKAKADTYTGPGGSKRD
jgi:hypothetical protein